MIKASFRCRIAILIFLIPIGNCPAGAADPNKGRAKAILADAESLEKQGKLWEAKAKYEQCLSIAHLDKASDRLAGLKVKLADDLTANASKFFSTGESTRAIRELERADELTPRNSRTLYNLAVCHAKLGDREKALSYLNQCDRALSAKSAEREKIAELRSVLITGESVRPVSDESKSAVLEVNKALTIRLEDKGDEVKNYQQSELEQEKQKCTILKENAAALPRTGVVIFNLAKCAQEEGRIDDANSFFSEYLKVTSDPLDKPDVQFRLKDIQTLLGLQGDQARSIRELYAEAYRMITIRRFDRAIDLYQRAEALYPSYPQTKYKLALLYDGSANSSLARKYLSDYLVLETNQEARDHAERLLSTLDQRRDEFLKLLTRGRAILGKGKMSDAEAEFNKAATIFPLSPEVNSLLGYVYLRGNNPEAARRAFDVVWAFGYPISFYAHVWEVLPTQAAGAFPMRFGRAKVEIEHDDFRLIYLTQLRPPKKKKEERRLKFAMAHGLWADLKPSENTSPTKVSSVGDKLANVSGPSKTVLTNDDYSGEVRVVPRTSIKNIQTDHAAVFVELEGPKIKVHYAWAVNGKLPEGFRIVPDVPFVVPEHGWPARKFANNYSRFFSQYLGVDDVRLGAEHMTKMEKALIAGEVASAALGNMSGLATASGNIAMALSAASGAAAGFSRLQTAVFEERALAQTLDFKLIPSQTTDLTFRTEEFH